MLYNEKLKKELSELTDKELQERITYELIDTKKKVDNIKNNIQFFFCATITPLILLVLFKLIISI